MSNAPSLDVVHRLTKTLKALENGRDRTLEDLVRLSRIPSVSARPVPDPAVKASAACVADLMRAAGLEKVEVLEIEGAHPYVVGERIVGPKLPTVLLYAHHDVQPEGDHARWTTPPFEPTRRGDRLYGRGVVDDKAGVMVHLAAIRAWKEGAGTLPLNVKFVVEGEEEIGSEHLEAFLQAYRERLQADVIVLTDTSNLEARLPSLTTRLRGLVKLQVEVKGYDHALHSGFWGGPVPDPVMGLCRLLGSLVRADGSIAVKGCLAGAKAPTMAQKKALARLPFDPAAFRRDAGAVKGLELHAASGAATYASQWFTPQLAITALEASPVEGSSNQIVPSARCRIGVRIVGGQDPKKVEKALIAHLKARVPWGLQLNIRPMTAGPAWSTETKGPAFEAAKRALAAGYGREPVEIGAGGSIPFVGPFARALGGVPALLIGLEDPACNAHAEDESLFLPDFDASCRSAVHLYAELADAIEPARARR
jgi:acetylornithine deacetylase/succinyl-diaminopimelate desuccinylase-like protein